MWSLSDSMLGDSRDGSEEITLPRSVDCVSEREGFQFSTQTNICQNVEEMILCQALHARSENTGVCLDSRKSKPGVSR